MTAHGVMFHHFYNHEHPKGQGAISANELAELIDYIGPERVLTAEEWMHRTLTGTLNDSDICLTFDDALLCQYEVAAPVLRDLGLTAFWFVYSSVFENNIEPLEVYRHFRTIKFPSIDDFYAEFLHSTLREFPDEYNISLSKFRPDAYLSDFPFYTENDRIFRYLRDDLLGPERYHSVMAALMASFDFDATSIASRLWMANEHLIALRDEGHVIGLHSYSHPTRFAALSLEAQHAEYRRNFDHLHDVLGEPPVCMSHPCNSYNQETLSILRHLGVQLGFRSNMQHLIDRSSLELSREDHTNIMQRIRS